MCLREKSSIAYSILNSTRIKPESAIGKESNLTLNPQTLNLMYHLYVDQDLSYFFVSAISKKVAINTPHFPPGLLV